MPVRDLSLLSVSPDVESWEFPFRFLLRPMRCLEKLDSMFKHLGTFWFPFHYYYGLILNNLGSLIQFLKNLPRKRSSACGGQLPHLGPRPPAPPGSSPAQAPLVLLLLLLASLPHSPPGGLRLASPHTRKPIPCNNLQCLLVVASLCAPAGSPPTGFVMRTEVTQQRARLIDVQT